MYFIDLSKNSSWIYWFFCKVVCVSITFSSALIWVISCLLLAFAFFQSYYCSSFNFDDRVSILDLSLLLMWASNFRLDTALNVCQRFWYIVSLFSLASKKLPISALISLFIQESLRSRLFNFYEIVCFWVSFLILTSNLMALWSKRLFVMISAVFSFAEE